MKIYKYCSLLALFLLASCASRSIGTDRPEMISLQVLDRNGFSETISVKDRLSVYEKIDFMKPQPYQKVLRVYARDSQGRSRSKITSYHSNGGLWQYLEVVDGRAHGKYREWYESGKKKIESTVIEGTADISDVAHMTWIFDGKCTVWAEDESVLAEFYYDKGLLEGASLYYHPNGKLWKSIPYLKNEIQGTVTVMDEKGFLVEKIEYENGKKQGLAVGYWNEGIPWYTEAYEKDLLITASYYDPAGSLVAEIQNGFGKQAVFKEGKLEMLREYRNGLLEGIIEIFSPEGYLQNSYTIKNGKKNGEEWEYYPPSKDAAHRSPQPKLYLFWHDDVIQGTAKTWYDNGVVESQKEMTGNKKQGMSFAWYKDGALMLVEEYQNDLLQKGMYYKKGDKVPVSKIEDGKGMATIYNEEGLLIKKIPYEKGKPSLDAIIP